MASTVSEIDTLLTLNHPRAFMYEFDPTVDVRTLTSTRLHPAGVRTFTYDRSATLSQAQIKTYFDTGFDVVSTQLATNAVNARKQVNTERGVTPP